MRRLGAPEPPGRSVFPDLQLSRYTSRTGSARMTPATPGTGGCSRMTSTDERRCDMTTTQGRTTGRMTSSPAQTAATVVALVFLVVGILGFIPGVTTHYGD